MTYTELERWWEVDFNVFTSTVVAEATGKVHPTVSEALHSEDWLEQWADGLYAAAGELMSSVEHMTFLNDPRLKATLKRVGQVEQRRGQVNTEVRGLLQAQGWEMLPDSHKDARLACIAILARHYPDETAALATEELARQGLPENTPFYGRPWADKFDAIEDAVLLGILEAPSTPEVQALLRLSPRELTEVVARDVNVQEDRCAELRHPLVLRGWLGALIHLRDRHCELSGLEPHFTVSLPRLDIDALRDLREADARQQINRRRFIRGLAQRYRECNMHARQLVRAASIRKEALERPWFACRKAARAEVARRHPEQFQALLSAFEPFCEPGSTTIRPELVRRGGIVSAHLIPMLKKALADGTWVQLVGGKAA
jgi:hypothetical protein